MGSKLRSKRFQLSVSSEDFIKCNYDVGLEIAYALKKKKLDTDPKGGWNPPPTLPPKCSLSSRED